jgi:hypothetical protein
MRKKKFILGTGLFTAGVLAVLAVDPAWWTDAGVTGTSSNKSPANIGQVKNMAANFHMELNGGFTGSHEYLLPGGAGIPLNEIFPDKPGPTASNQWVADQLQVANIGQLKHVASFYYERLNILAPKWVEEQMEENGIDMTSWEHPVPWDPDTPVAENNVVANLGQLKLVFSLRIREDDEATPDQIPDLLEHILYGSNTGNGSTTDYDGDGLSDRDELFPPPASPPTPATSPFEADTDGDGFDDSEDPNPLTAEDDGSATGASTLKVITPLQ